MSAKAFKVTAVRGMCHGEVSIQMAFKSDWLDAILWKQVAYTTESRATATLKRTAKKWHLKEDDIISEEGACLLGWIANRA